MSQFKQLALGAILSITTAASALAQKPVSLTLPASSLASLTGAKFIAVSDSGKTTSAAIAGKTTSLAMPGANAKIYLLAGGKVGGIVVVPQCAVSKCSGAATKAKVFSQVKAGGALKLKVKNGLLVAESTSKNFKKLAAGKTVAAGVLASNVASRGYVLTKASSKAASTGLDGDGDGLVAPVDVDDDGDGVLDNYDTSSSTSPSSTTVSVFSNLKLDIENSLNLHATGLDSTRLDQALQNAQTLAIQVAADSPSTVELDCGSLGYCSSGGTGKTGANFTDAFPGAAGGAFDGDGDGKGTITKGATGDFQLKTNAGASGIGAGDAFLEVVNEGGTDETTLAGTLNFVFNSTPAIKSIAVGSGATQTVDYAVTPKLGQRGNCIDVPATGDVVLNITGWRPQRPGITEAGEAEFVDIGSSLITVDIPNGACSTEDGFSCAPQGPGNCAASAYTTTDANLSIGTEGLQDNAGDADAASTNTYSFALNLTNCLSTARSGAVTWGAGQSLFLDLQFRSRNGDNAAQKFCVVRAAS